MIIYEALYNWMIEESSAKTISIHKTRQGARNALAKKIRERHEEHNRLYNYDVSEMCFRFGTYEEWRVNKTELLD